jgi:hypothetical protein
MDPILSEQHNGPRAMSTSIFFLVVVAFVSGVLSGVLLVALLHTARDSDRGRPPIDARGLHPLDLPTH